MEICDWMGSGWVVGSEYVGSEGNAPQPQFFVQRVRNRLKTEELSFW
jgi:hypothetical protein